MDGAGNSVAVLLLWSGAVSDRFSGLRAIDLLLMLDAGGAATVAGAAPIVGEAPIAGEATSAGWPPMTGAAGLSSRDIRPCCGREEGCLTQKTLND